MNTIQIWNALSANQYTNKYFKGVFPIDRIPKFIRSRPALLVVNTDKSNQPGTHWIALYLNSKGSVEYFDSYGREPKHKEFIKFFKRNKLHTIFYNKTQLQSFLSDVCGQYCCVYLLQKSKKCTLNNFVNKYFKGQSFILNDIKVNKLFSDNFPDFKIIKSSNKKFIKQVQTCHKLITPCK